MPIFQLGPRIEDLGEAQQQKKKKKKATITMSLPIAASYKLAARLSLLQSFLARRGWVDEVAIDAATQAPGVLLDDLPLRLGRGDLFVRRNTGSRHGTFLVRSFFLQFWFLNFDLNVLVANLVGEGCG